MFFYSNKDEITGNHFYTLNLKNQKITRITNESGTHRIMASYDGTYFLDIYTFLSGKIYTYNKKYYYFDLVYIKYKKIEDVTSIKIEDVVKIFFAGKYFCNTHVGLSAKNHIKFQNHKNIQIKRVDFN